MVQLVEQVQKQFIMKEKLAKLIDVKTIVTFALIAVVCYLAITSKLQLSAEFFASIVTAVITYFFTRKNPGGDVK